MRFYREKGALREGDLPVEPEANRGCGRCGTELAPGECLVYMLGRGMGLLCQACWDQTDRVERWYYADRVIHWWLWEAMIRTDLGERRVREIMEESNAIFHTIMDTDQNLGWSDWRRLHPEERLSVVE